ncbi:hypothetical protein DFH94DRAFT_632644 [Russula ochroleuca]|uniref:Mitochondrial distribution and morphology protein 12 n=1 Tax=Russula ochroleuca TaxID=152965 RepID=A0A9P5T856_9AGAM|nr:hypothetical protein DFH94DRAFT_632644 [Russula ochroleuca]
MSIDLDWSKLDASYASSLIDVLNRQLQRTPRPSFIGPIEITSFDFGSQPPAVELVDLRDIYHDFLEDDEDEEEAGSHNNIDAERGSRYSAAGNGNGQDRDEDDEFEWVSRRSARRGMAMDEAAAPMYYHHLPPHVRYARGPASEVLHHLQPSSSSSFGEAPGSSVWNAGGLQHVGATHSSEHPTFSQSASASSAAVAAEDEHPNLQLHLLVSWHSDLRLTLTTSLRINYPSPLFMSLPIKLSVTGLVFDGELAVAYEGGRRVHLCVLDGLDPYGPSARRSAGSQGSTPSDPEGDDAHAAKPLPVGQRLLPEIFIESELGQADKHVLKNVTRVEKFIQDVIRKTVEEELVFPNFHTLVLK